MSAALVPAEGEPSASASQLLVLPAILGMLGWWEHPHSASVFQAFPLSRACAPFFQGLDQGRPLRYDLVLTDHACNGRAS